MTTARARLRSTPFVLTLAFLLAVVMAPSPGSSAAPRDQRWTFEADDLGTVPTGCETAVDYQPAQVTDEIAYEGERALGLVESAADQRVGVRCAYAATAGVDLRLKVHPAQFADGFGVALLGSFTGVERPELPVFQFWIKPDGSVFWFDGLAQDALGWTQIGAAGTVPTGRWSALAVQVPADLSHAVLHAMKGSEDDPSLGSYVGAAGPVGIAPVEQVSGFQVSTAHVTTGSDRVQVDDVSIGGVNRVVEPPRHPNFAIGSRTVIESTDEGLMQMPNSSVTRRLPDGGHEVLVSYPVHGDATHDTGTALAASTDRGRTWRDVSERNPFPGEQSFYLSALRNGDLLAVNYHTFMTAGTDNRQAAVPTAVSSDGGRTWIHREGQMTAPERMRPISDATSRPGSPLGGFVLVHSVLEADDGTLFQSGYGYYERDGRYRSIVMASTDRGENWTVRSTIATNDQLSDHPRFEGFGEPALAFASDGALLAVMRTGNYQPLYLARSNNQGRSWSDPEKVTAGPDAIPVTGVFPDLKLMANGTLVLWVGRPGQFLLADPQGTGEQWSRPEMVDYYNSGNGTLTPVGRNQLLVFGDRGADWTPNTRPRKEIWVRPVVVKRPTR